MESLYGVELIILAMIGLAIGALWIFFKRR